MNKRKETEEKIFRIISCMANGLLILVLLLIILIVFIKGFSAISLDMILRTPRGGYYYGGEGGVLNAIMGSLYISLGAIFIAIALGAPAALFINTYLIGYPRTQNTIRYFLDALWGIPSIVYGAFGFTLMVYIGLNASLLAGIITVSLLVTPIVIRSFDQALSTIPKGLHEASLALGSSRAEMAFRIIFKQGFSGFITAVLLAFGRAIGDAASVLFTAGYTDNIPKSLTEPAATLPLAIFFQLSSPIPQVRERAYAAAIILTIIILIISITARLLSKKYSRLNHK